MIEFHCPHCDKTLKTSPDRAGLQAKCPGCGEVVVVPAPPQDTTNLDQPHDGKFNKTSLDSTASVPDEIEIRCPECQEPILADQTRCSLCGTTFERDQLHPERLSRRRETRPFPPGEVINEALRIFSLHWALLAGVFLIKVALIGLPAILLFALFALAQQFQVRDADESVIVITLMVAFCVFLLMTFALSMYLLAGSLVFHLKVAREQPATIRDLFSGGPYWGRMMVCGFVVNMVIGLGYAACFVPGVLLQAVFLPYGYILVAENRSSMDCLSRSKEMTDGNWGSLLLIVLVGLGCYYAGAVACYIGMIFTMPFVDLLYALAYERMLQQTPLRKRESN